MEILLFIFIILAMYHYFTESVLVPTLRNSVVMEIRELSDRLTDLKCQYGNRIPDEVYWQLKTTMGYTASRAEQHNILDFMAFQYRYHKNPDRFKKSEIVNEIENIDIQDYQLILSEYQEKIRNVFVINMVGWFIYLLPIIIVRFCLLLFKKSDNGIQFLIHELKKNNYNSQSASFNSKHTPAFA